MKTGLIVITALLALAVPAIAATSPTGKSAAEIRAYYSSGDWNRAVKKQADRAKAYIDKRTQGKRAAKKPALVLDIDETSLNNYPCLDRTDGLPYEGGPYAGCVVEFKAPAIKPVLSVFKLAKQRHVHVVFITGRPEGIRDGTLQNLKAAGFKGKYDLVLQPPSRGGDASMVPYKSGARRQVEKRGYTIIANLGDQRSDLKGGYSERTYKLPNVIYRTP
jgi:predicted secreted acid phosphatase